MCLPVIGHFFFYYYFQLIKNKTHGRHYWRSSDHGFDFPKTPDQLLLLPQKSFKPVWLPQ